MRRLSPPAGCGGCSVGGKPDRCLQDSVNRGNRVRHHPRPRPTAGSRFSSRRGSEWTVGAAPARSRCPPGHPWPGLARGRAAERVHVRAHFFGSFARAWGGPLRFGPSANTYCTKKTFFPCLLRSPFRRNVSSRTARPRCHGASARAHESDATRRSFDRTLRVLLWIPGCGRTTIGPWRDVLSLHLRHVARLGTKAHDLVVQWRAGCPQYVRALPGVWPLSALRRVVCHR